MRLPLRIAHRLLDNQLDGWMLKLPPALPPQLGEELQKCMAFVLADIKKQLPEQNTPEAVYSLLHRIHVALLPQHATTELEAAESGDPFPAIRQAQGDLNLLTQWANEGRFDNQKLLLTYAAWFWSGACWQVAQELGRSALEDHQAPAPPLVWRGRLNELAQLFLQLQDNGWLAPSTNGRARARLLTELFMLESGPINENSLYQCMTGEVTKHKPDQPVYWHSAYPKAFGADTDSYPFSILQRTDNHRH